MLRPARMRSPELPVAADFSLREAQTPIKNIIK